MLQFHSLRHAGQLAKRADPESRDCNFGFEIPGSMLRIAPE
jgi:hypothetical protein